MHCTWHIRDNTSRYSPGTLPVISWYFSRTFTVFFSLSSSISHNLAGTLQVHFPYFTGRLPVLSQYYPRTLEVFTQCFLWTFLMLSLYFSDTFKVHSLFFPGTCQVLSWYHHTFLFTFLTLSRFFLIIYLYVFEMLSSFYILFNFLKIFFCL